MWWPICVNPRYGGGINPRYGGFSRQKTKIHDYTKFDLGYRCTLLLFAHGHDICDRLIYDMWHYRCMIWYYDMYMWHDVYILGISVRILMGRIGPICQIPCISSYFRPVSTLSILTIFLYICRYVSVGVAGVGGQIKWLTATGHMCWWQGLCLCIACVLLSHVYDHVVYDMWAMGCTMLCIWPMYLWVVGLMSWMYYDGLEPRVVWSMMYVCMCMSHDCCYGYCYCYYCCVGW